MILIGDLLRSSKPSISLGSNHSQGNIERERKRQRQRTSKLIQNHPKSHEIRSPFHEKNRTFICVIYLGWEPATVNPCECSMLGRTWNFRPCWWAHWSMHWFGKCSGKPYIIFIRAAINWCPRFYLPSNFGLNLLVVFFSTGRLPLGPWGLRASTFGAWVRGSLLTETYRPFIAQRRTLSWNVRKRQILRPPHN